MTPFECGIWQSAFALAIQNGSKVPVWHANGAVQLFRKKCVGGDAGFPLSEGNVEVFTCETHGHQWPIGEPRRDTDICGRCEKSWRALTSPTVVGEEES